jgi:hypothetical protein
MPNNVVLRLENVGPTALCLPDVEVKEAVLFTQFGKTVQPFYYSNRAILRWRGADLISGMIVVPPGKRFEIFYDLNEWVLKRGKAAASITIPEYDCLTFFQESSPRPTRATSHFSFDAPMSVAPKD